jgi:hypothetical protein
VVDYRLPEKFKVPQIQNYVEIEDPVEHLENFRVHLDLHGTPDEVACWAFALTLTENAWDWFRRLPPGFVDKFEGLDREFWGQFMAVRMPKKPLGYLLMLQQGSSETLKDFMACFNSKKMTVEDPTDDMIFAPLYQGLSQEGLLMRKLARKQPSTMHGLMDKVEEFINQEETLKTMISSRRPQETTMEKKEFKKGSKEEQKRVKKVQDYNFTPLNTRAAEVFMDIKND